MKLADLFGQMREQSRRVIVGQDAAFELLCVAFFANGHALLEGVPGTAKTLLAKTLARLVNAEFRRIQFTPDLMPSDIVGTQVFDMGRAQFNLRRGPIFTQIALADEINRAPAKTQAALLEAMEERQVTIDGERHPLADPFLVLATQNPVESEGTYPLPEAQLDRFLFKIVVDYPPLDAEQEVLRRYHTGFDAHRLDDLNLPALVQPADLPALRQEIQAITVEDGLIGYVAAIAAATRRSPDLLLGASPRASIALLQAAKTYAALRGHEFVTPDDVKALVGPTFRHRVILKPEAEIEGLNADTVLRRVVGGVEVPR